MVREFSETQMRFKEGFNNWIIRHGYQVNMIADNLMMHPSTISGWRNGTAFPSSSSINGLKLMGLKIPGVVPEEEFNPKYVRDFLSSHGLSVCGLSGLASIAQGSLSNWLNGKADLSLDSYARLVCFVENYGDEDWDKDLYPSSVEDESRDDVKSEDKKEGDQEMENKEGRTVVLNDNDVVVTVNEEFTESSIGEILAWAWKQDMFEKVLNSAATVNGKPIANFSVTLDKHMNVTLRLEV